MVPLGPISGEYNSTMNNSRIVLVTGDRDWDDENAVKAFVETLNPYTDIVIEGHARGADKITFDECIYKGVPTLAVPALWNLQGRAAGPLRNRKMVQIIGTPDVCVYFHNDLESSKGTKHMVNTARSMDILVYSWREWVDLHLNLL